MDRLLTPADAARILGVVPATVRVMADAGKLPAVRTERGIRLFRRADVDQLAAKRARAREAQDDADTLCDEQEENQ